MPDAPRSSMFGSTLEKPLTAHDQGIKGLFDVALSKVLASISSTPVAAQVRSTPDCHGIVLRHPVVLQTVDAPSTGKSPNSTVPLVPPVTSMSPSSAAAPTEPEQIPYIKPASRALKSEQRDDIVIVGRQSKKRRKDKATDDSSATPEVQQDMETSTPQKKKRLPVRPEDIPEFSYAEEPNQLDTFSEETKAKVKKAKKVKKRECDILCLYGRKHES
jgi:hypothetical protein